MQEDNKYKFWISVLFITLGLFILILSLRTLISNEVSKQTLLMQENHAKEIAELTIKLEKEKVDTETKLKNDIIGLNEEIAKCKLEIEEAKNKKEYKELSKKNPQEFRKKVDEILGVKGKTK